jgi:predicted DNA binding CopG/RHH family protein
MKGKNMKNKSATEDSETHMLNIRLQEELIKRVKVLCDEKEITVQDFVTDAIIEKLGLVHKERRKKSRL